ncbi:MAG TPA: RNA methyltransferase [Polyangiaceae bacterium]
MRKLAVALVHHPILDAQGGIVTTAVTNLDVHDISRSAKTYGATDYFVCHPIEAQRNLVNRICDHWAHGSSGNRIPSRKDALALVRVVESLEAAVEAFGGRQNVEIWVTAARDVAPPITLKEARTRLESDGKDVLIVYGTGWGLAPAVIEMADYVLEPVRAEKNADYNHLSVRSACAIILDRLRGVR